MHQAALDTIDVLTQHVSQNACTNKTFCSTSTRFYSYCGCPVKVGIKFVHVRENAFFLHVVSYIHIFDLTHLAGSHCTIVT